MTNPANPSPLAHNALHFAPLSKAHAREAFACSRHPVLAKYIREQAMQDMTKHVAAPCALVDARGTIIGYYTLSAASVTLDQIPPAAAKGLPSYPQIGAVRIGRLAVGDQFLGQGHGKRLLMNALDRIAQAATTLGVAFVIVDAKDDEAAEFYAKYGFEPFPGTPMSLFLPMRTLLALFGRP
ncbi:MAG: GNAT family N-acetyltransferase [Gemmatimonadota bacterium]|nr:GNAT family N-acetyltransferase [Gemmatimonadota bacterium]